MFKDWDEPIKMPTKKQLALTLWALGLVFFCFLCFLLGYFAYTLCTLEANSIIRPSYCW